MRVYWISCALLASTSSACTLFDNVTFRDGGPLDGSTPSDAATVDASCPSGRFDCDNDPSTCETRESPAACGGCRPCELPSAIPSCSNGRCAIAQCVEGFADCNGRPEDGCEVRTSDDRMHCGRCEMQCAESEVCSNGMCRPACPGSQRLCTGQCVDTQSDPNNCGSCGTVCPSPANARGVCRMGRCSVRCNTGFEDCNGMPDDGCEERLGTISNCRTCRDRCTSSEYCRFDGTAYSCQSSCSNPGCGLICVNLQSNAIHCGGCTLPGMGNFTCNAVNGSNLCERGTCVPMCDPGFGNCDAMMPNGNNNGCETALTTTSNCGACGRACRGPNANNACVADGMGGYACAIGSCAAGFGNCDSIVDNGCESSLDTDVNNCGACGRRCATGAGTNVMSATCSAGRCQLTCAPGFADCDGNPSNGCEANLTSNEHCGFCRNNCTSMSGCSTGSFTCGLRMGTSRYDCLCGGR